MNGNQSIQVSLEPQASNHAVIILASGLSQRLGQAKQLLHKDGEPLIRYMTKLAVATQPQAIIVVIPDNSSAIDSAINELSVQYSAIQVVVNLLPETGMAHSLYLGIEALTDVTDLSIERVLIMGIDQILLDEPHLIALLAGKQAVVASGYHSWTYLDKANTTDTLKKDIIGLPSVIDYELLKRWQSTLIGDKGLRHLIRSLPSSRISTVTNAQLSYDIDTPEQCAYAQQRGWLDK
ncbi:nucleotidyltransferase family protein [Psychrobacter sp. AOP22-C1-C5]|uniref:nucleotidyltransferase family protein n=1 Tax=Psychrobacter sp. AOP22-C1-C5 TaxID=3457716 RepID=UPI004036CD9E